jgi:hypothetical protein
MSATKEELEEMGKDLFKRLGGMRTKDGRIVRGLLALWKAAESNLAVIETEQKMQPTLPTHCPECGSDVVVCMMGHYCGEKRPAANA